MPLPLCNPAPPCPPPARGEGGGGGTIHTMQLNITRTKHYTRKKLRTERSRQIKLIGIAWFPSLPCSSFLLCVMKRHLVPEMVADLLQIIPEVLALQPSSFHGAA